MKQLLLLLLSLQLFAQDGLYIEGSLGSSLQSSIDVEGASYSYNYGYSGALGLGYQVNAWKFEIEGIYLQNKITAYNISTSYDVSGDLIRQYGLFNIYHNFTNESNLITSLGLGLGVSQRSVNALSIANTHFEVEESSALAYQGIINIGYMFNEHFTLGAKLRYLESIDKEKKRIGDTLLGIYSAYLF